VDNGTRHAFVLAGGDYLHTRHICTTSVIALEAGTGQLLYRTPIRAGVGPYTSPSLAIDEPAFRLVALDAGYTLQGAGTARPVAQNSVAIVDTRTGRLVTSLHIGGEQGELGPIAVDVHTSRT
jgi:hypothetical protein